jgi:hypothetical protein
MTNDSMFVTSIESIEIRNKNLGPETFQYCSKIFQATVVSLHFLSKKSISANHSVICIKLSKYFLSLFNLFSSYPSSFYLTFP